MMIKEFENMLYKIQGKTIAIVYIFEGENAIGYEHYDIWKSDVISEWLSAIQENYCRPLIMDARTFIDKAISNTLPKIDAVLNLNNGNTELSTLSLIPSICSFIGVPCIPCNAVSIIAGENKYISNCVAKNCGLNIPKEVDFGDSGIFRTLNYGSSRGTYKSEHIKKMSNGFSQEFINGYDITTPLLYHPFTYELEILPSVMYYPINLDTNWFFNETVKENRSGYKKRIVNIDKQTEFLYKELAKKLHINTFCRIDARIKCDNKNEWNELCNNTISNDRIFFIEINPMPTLKKNINFHNSLNSLEANSSFYKLYDIYNNIRNESSPTGFILACSIIAQTKAKC